MNRASVACVVVALASVVCLAAPPGAQSEQKPAAQPDPSPSAAISRLTKEKAQLAAELVKKDKQIETLTRLLKENGIEVPDEGAGATPSAAAAPAPKAARAAVTNDRSEADAVPAGAAAPSEKGPWTVRIVSNEEPDQNQLREQLAEAVGKLKFADKALAEAKQRHDEMAGAREWYTSNRGRGDYKPKYTNAEMAEPRRDVAKAEAEKRRAAQTVARLERQVADAGKSHMVVAQLDDGTTVELTAASPAQVQLARGLQVGERYRVSGVGRLDEGTLRVKMSSAAPVARPRGVGAPGRAAAAPAVPQSEEAEADPGVSEPAAAPVPPPARTPAPAPAARPAPTRRPQTPAPF